jgi:hypothetical protein
VPGIRRYTREIDGGMAHCESYVIGTLLPRSVPGRAKFVSGRYLDRLEPRDGEWRAWDTRGLSYAGPLQLDSRSLLRDGETR